MEKTISLTEEKLLELVSAAVMHGAVESFALGMEFPIAEDSPLVTLEVYKKWAAQYPHRFEDAQQLIEEYLSPVQQALRERILSGKMDS